MKKLGVVSSGITRAGSMAVLGVALLWAGNLRANPARPGQAAEEETPLKLKVGRPIVESDFTEGSLKLHGLPAKTENGKKAKQLASHPVATVAKARNHSEEQGGISFYPADLSYQGGPVLTSTESHAVYVNCTASCFGHPTQFLRDLGKSNFLHMTDEYVGVNGNHRYTVGQSGEIANYPVSGPLGPLDIVTLVYESAQAFGTGYGHVHHIFFAPGIDVCSDLALTVCYSPDNFNTWFFCAFHGSIDFQDIGHVLFTIEPYQNVLGCQVGQPSPNGPVVDSTVSVLSHELFEAITDPDGDAWWNTNSLGLGGAEIGDECQDSAFIYQTPSINGTLYEVQPEYSNVTHSCAYRDPGAE